MAHYDDMTNDALSPRQEETRQLVARAQMRRRRTIVRIQLLGSTVLVASTLFAWENHPRVFRARAAPGYVVREVGHTIGLATICAGLLVLVLGLVSLAVAARLRNVNVAAGFSAFACSFGALGVCVVEVIQLWIGRRDWLATLVPMPTSSPLDHAVGFGAWLATVASVALTANTTTYLWLCRRRWRASDPITG